MLYKPSALVSPGKVTLVSTLVASTFTPGITPPLGSVTRPVSVAVGPATRQAANDISSAKRWLLDIIAFNLQNFSPDYARVCRPNCRFVPTCTERVRDDWGSPSGRRTGICGPWVADFRPGARRLQKPSRFPLECGDPRI